MGALADLSSYELADWRRRINDLYSIVRATESPLAAWQHWHTTRSRLFRDHPMSPIPEPERAAFGEILVFDYDPALRFEVTLEPTRISADPVSIELGSDGSLSYSAVARTCGLKQALGTDLTVYWIEGYGGGLFLPFRDATNASESYGGGRYIIDAIKGADLGLGPNGGLILDFNFAYNPSCALNPEYVCPLSPPENTLPVSIRGGEKLSDTQGLTA